MLCGADSHDNANPTLKLKTSGVLSNAALAASAAASAASAAATAATAAASAATAALEAINAVLPEAQRLPMKAKPAATVRAGEPATAIVKSPEAIQDLAAAESEASPAGTRSSDSRFIVPSEQTLIGLVGNYEIPVTVDSAGEFGNGISGTQAIESAMVNRDSETSLGESIGAGREFSRDVLVAGTRVDQARAQSGQALALLLPSLALRTSGGRETSTPSVALDAAGVPIASDTHRRTDTSLILRQPLIDLPGLFDYQRRGVIEQSRDESRRAADGDAYLSSVNAYLALISSRLQADMARDFEVQLKDLLSYVEKRAKAGASSTSDMARVSARSLAAKSSRLEQDAAHAAAGVEFVRLTNLAPRMARLPELNELGAATMPASLNRAVEVAMESNPDIAALVTEARAAEIDRTAAKGRFLPRLDLEFSDTKSLHAGGDTDPDGQREKRAMLVLNWSIFSGGADYQYGKERASRHLELKYRLDDQRRRVVQTLSAQYATLTSTRERLTTGYRELKSMAVAAEAMSKRMLSGNQSLLDLLDVYDRYYQARVRLVNLHIQEMGSVAQVVRLAQGVPQLASAKQPGQLSATPSLAVVDSKAAPVPEPMARAIQPAAPNAAPVSARAGSAFVVTPGLISATDSPPAATIAPAELPAVLSPEAPARKQEG
jgi:adhesin transport system outer membrane protein